MRIIQPGIIDLENEIRLKCNTCEAVFDICAEDISKDTGVRRFYTTCPYSGCKRRIDIPEGSIPRKIFWKVNLRETN